MADMHLPVAAPDYEALFRVTFEHAAIGIAHVAPDGRWIRVNQKLCDILGYSLEELSELSFQDLTHADDLAEDMRQVGRLLAQESPSYQLEKRYVRKDGEVIWANLSVSLVRDAMGQPDFFISVVEDIQARKNAEETIRLNRAELQVIFDNLDTGLITSTMSGDMVYWNRSALDMFGFASLDECRFNIANFIDTYEMLTSHGHVLPFGDWPLLRILRGETLRGLELTIRRKDGSWLRRFRHRGSLALDSTGKSVIALLAFSDVTDEKT